jgi:hypothetical protein
MFRIPDYVAETRLEGAAPPRVRADPGVGRAVTRLGGAFSAAGNRLARQAAAPARTDDIPQRPPSAEETRLRAHMEKRRAQAAGFAAERRYLDLQAEAEAARQTAREKAGASGEGYARIYAGGLERLTDRFRRGLQTGLADDHRAAMEARAGAEAARRLDRAAADEVRIARDAVRRELAGMQARLLDEIAREPERYEEVAAQGAAFTAANILPEAETAALVAEWLDRAEGARNEALSGSEAAEGDPAAADGDADRPSLSSNTTGGRQDGASPLPERKDVVIAVIDAPAVVEAWEDYEQDPTPANLRQISEVLVEAQADAGIPAEERTPISLGEERNLAETILKEQGDARLVAIRRLAAGLQERHGTAADLALRAVAGHWADDERATAFADFLAGEMDTARIVDPGELPTAEAAIENAADANSKSDHAAIDAAWNRAADAPPSEAMLAYAEDAAKRQRTSPQVRGANGNFLRGAPLGEVIQTSEGDGFYDRGGAFRLADQSRHVVLLDPVSSRWLVFERTLAHDIYTRGALLPFRRNDRTGKWEFALPDVLNGSLQAVKLPYDVYSGRVDLASPEGFERAVDAAGSFTGSGLVTRARPGSVGMGLRRPPKRTGNAVQSKSGSGSDGTDDAPVKYNPITRLHAQFVLAQYKKNADKIFESASAAEYFGPVWNRLPPHMQDFLGPRYQDFVGKAHESNVTEYLKKAGFNNKQKRYFELPAGVGRSARIYDEATSEELELALRELLVRPGKKNEAPTVIEAKVASSRQTPDQKNANAHLSEQKEIARIEVLRVPANRIKAKDLADVIDKWLERRDGQLRPGGVPRRDVEDLVRRLRKHRGPDGKLLTIGQVSLVVLATTLPLLYPSETGEAERP